MNKLLLFVLGLILLGGVLTYSGCGPRFGVMKDKALAEIDKILNELDVKQKSIEMKYKELQTELERVREQRIEAEVRVEQLTQKKKLKETQLAELDAKLSKIREILVQFGDQGEIERNGTKYTKADVDKMAQELIADRTALAKSIESTYVGGVDTMKRASEYLRNNEEAAKTTLAAMERKIEEIKSKKEAIDVVRDASSTMGSDTTLLSKIEALNKEVEDLDIDIETKMRVEEAKLKEFATQSKSIDELLAEPADLGNTLNEIDQILGKSTGDGG